MQNHEHQEHKVGKRDNVSDAFTFTQATQKEVQNEEVAKSAEWKDEATTLTAAKLKKLFKLTEDSLAEEIFETPPKEEVTEEEWRKLFELGKDSLAQEILKEELEDEATTLTAEKWEKFFKLTEDSLAQEILKEELENQAATVTEEEWKKLFKLTKDSLAEEIFKTPPKEEVTEEEWRKLFELGKDSLAQEILKEELEDEELEETLREVKLAELLGLNKITPSEDKEVIDNKYNELISTLIKFNKHNELYNLFLIKSIKFASAYQLLIETYDDKDIRKAHQTEHDRLIGEIENLANILTNWNANNLSNNIEESYKKIVQQIQKIGVNYQDILHQSINNL